MNDNNIHKNCKGCIYENNEGVCGENCNYFEDQLDEDNALACNAIKIIPPSGIDRFGSKSACVYECHWCKENRKLKEPLSRYDWAYS